MSSFGSCWVMKKEMEPEWLWSLDVQLVQIYSMAVLKIVKDLVNESFDDNSESDPDSLFNANTPYQIEELFYVAWSKLNFEAIFKGWESRIMDYFYQLVWSDVASAWQKSKCCPTWRENLKQSMIESGSLELDLQGALHEEQYFVCGQSTTEQRTPKISFFGC